MKNSHIKTALLLMACVFAAFACSNSSSGSGGGTGGTGIISRGSISEFGSIVVNGTEFDTTDAIVVLKGIAVGTGDAAVREHLDVGKIVTVIGSGGEETEDAVADRVLYRSDIKGPVADIRNVGPESLAVQVLGQTVMINTLTRFDGISVDAISTGDAIEVSGYPDDTGTIWATFIQKHLPEATVEIVGNVYNLNDALQTFEINALAIDYSSAETFGLPDGGLAEGLRVEVEGMLDDSGTIFATKINLDDVLDGEAEGQLEVMGFVTGFTSIDEFVIDSQAVRVEAGAEIVDGTPADIAPGVKLEAEGVLVAGVLFAHEIEFWEPDQIELEGLVAELISDSAFRINGREVRTNAATVFEDGAPDEIAVGVNLEIKGYLENGILQADKVSFELD